MPLKEASLINLVLAFCAAITVFCFCCRLSDGFVFCGLLCLGEGYSATNAKSTVFIAYATILIGCFNLPLLPVGNHF